MELLTCLYLAIVLVFILSLFDDRNAVIVLFQSKSWSTLMLQLDLGGTDEAIANREGIYFSVHEIAVGSGPLDMEYNIFYTTMVILNTLYEEIKDLDNLDIPVSPNKRDVVEDYRYDV